MPPPGPHNYLPQSVHFWPVGSRFHPSHPFPSAIRGDAPLVAASSKRVSSCCTATNPATLVGNERLTSEASGKGSMPAIKPRRRQRRPSRGAGGFAPPGAATDRLSDLEPIQNNPGNLRGRFYRHPHLEGPAPLVVLLHGCTQDAANYDHGSRWSGASRIEQYSITGMAHRVPLAGGERAFGAQGAHMLEVGLSSTALNCGILRVAPRRRWGA